jgi:uncharacterized protein
MQCPIENTTLQMTTRDGIEIDYCPNCRGVWLDRGELDKLIERAGSYYGGRPQQQTQSQPPQGHHYDEDDDDDYKYRNQHGDHSDSHRGHHKKKEGFLGDLFDF